MTGILGPSDGLYSGTKGILAGRGRVRAQSHPRGFHPDTLRYVERAW